ncbi:hypothetical protein VC83_00789 [Pseudogymnoascus destructans]|uniref:Uncharacterized protein n=1 Tax=Pseudogymnoascus destructans TaxID=655981 RepID=A0A177ALC2_9PEZI|nr:uncharacterized protein VC83_00789 [Pseudogymnoascus destructans]OAF62620.1 hypothetical protein VC83_00789 [Pseudogymnoascus destructans]
MEFRGDRIEKVLIKEVDNDNSSIDEPLADSPPSLWQAYEGQDFEEPTVDSMSALAELSVTEDGAEFLDLDAVIRALDDWAVKDKFCFWTKKRDVNGATSNLAGWLAGIITETAANYIS